MISKKLTALGFIFLIISGNFWIIETTLGKAVPFWVLGLMYSGLFCLASGALCFLVNLVIYIWGYLYTSD